ncbi:MAG: drug/metabolite exporter YedA [Nitrospinae bacterium]|nr:drug/metabolite exporter YedA [Nitrospinota bacterium]
MNDGRTKIIAAFAAVYTFWGSTYLAIRFAIETLPPFLMSGVRFVIAGGLLFGYMALKGEKLPTTRQWRSTALIGALLLLGGNGGVVYAEERGVASGLTALLVATVPIWMALLDWRSRGRLNPGAWVSMGLAFGFLGVALLVLQNGAAEVHIDAIGAAVLLAASLSWAYGSIWARTADLPRSSLQTTGMQLLMGGLWLCIAGLLKGEAAHVGAAAWSVRSVASFFYLIFFGSIIGYSAYVYILKMSSPAKAGTYAYVNPAIAVFLGWALAGEKVTGITIVAAMIIIASVALITMRPRGAPARE